MQKRKFLPGSEWFYLKIYTGIKTSDLILEEAIQPLINYFQEIGYISKWFFIRYNDPESHLRLRLKLNNGKYYNEILDQINLTFQHYKESGEIATIVIDSYNQEIERYGKNTIENIETLFYLNSELTLQFLDYIDEEKIMISLFYINEALTQLNLSDKKKLNWTQHFNKAFKNEFNADKKLNAQLDKKYRTFKPYYIKFLEADEFSEERNIIISTVQKTNPTIDTIIHLYENNFLEIPIQHLFQSIFHMNINRLFVSNQRLFEMIIYDYLVRHYKSLVFLTLEVKS